MIKQPAYLKRGDKIAIVCPAKKLPSSINHAINILKEWGLEVLIGESVYASHHQFAGTDQLRTTDLQHFLDNSEVKAIIAARGGYGMIRIIDQLDFTLFNENPKWIVGFSDVTVLLSHLVSYTGTQCIHAQMPYTFEEATKESLVSLQHILFGNKPQYEYSSSFANRPGKASGPLVGGNLTLLCAVQGSVSEMNFDQKILFLEDVGEHEYAIDRMLRTLKRAGKLKNLSALILGAFNEISPEKIPFGQTVEQVIEEIVQEYDFPVCYDFPTGHIENNLAMVLGSSVEINIEKHQVNFKYI